MARRIAFNPSHREMANGRRYVKSEGRGAAAPQLAKWELGDALHALLCSVGHDLRVIFTTGNPSQSVVPFPKKHPSTSSQNPISKSPKGNLASLLKGLPYCFKAYVFYFAKSAKEKIETG